jgi:hypothetical protein
MIMQAKRLFLFVCLVTMLFPAGARSQEESNWQFNLAPLYLWAISIDGDLGIRGRTANASIDFSDVWDNLQGGLHRALQRLVQKQDRLRI